MTSSKDTPEPPPRTPRRLDADVQWSDHCRGLLPRSVKYVTLEALMRQAARAAFFMAPPLFTLPQTDHKSTFLVDISVIDDARMKELNKQYRDKNQSTDVLSFAQLENAPQQPASEKVLLGDIVISLPDAQRQAETHDHPPAEEMAFLTVHAMLHLLGYDHQTRADKTAMWKLQDAVMERVCGWSNSKR